MKNFGNYRLKILGCIGIILLSSLMLSACKPNQDKSELDFFWNFWGLRDCIRTDRAYNPETKYCNSKVIAKFAPDNSIVPMIEDELKSATKSIDVIMYSFSNKKLIKSLSEIASAGKVKVRLLLNYDTQYVFKKPLPGETERNCSLCNQLESAGIEIRYNISKKTHHKLAIIDGPDVESGSKKVLSSTTLITGSGNWGNSIDKSSKKPYDEDFIFFKRGNESRIFSFQYEFEFLWTNGKEWGLPAGSKTPAVDQNPDQVEMPEGNEEPENSENSETAEPAAEINLVNLDRQRKISTERPVSDAFFTSQNILPVEGKPGSWTDKRKTANGGVKESDGLVGQYILEQIQKARFSIDLAMNHFNKPVLYLAIKDAIKRGIRVRVILDGVEYGRRDYIAAVDADGKPTKKTSRYTELGLIECPTSQSDLDKPMVSTQNLDECLAKYLPDSLRFKTYAKYHEHRRAKQMHMKMIVIDKRKVITGSYNWSNNSEWEQFENIVSLKGGVVEDYIKKFEEMYEYGRYSFSLPNMINDVKGRVRDPQTNEIPCFFGPISLSYSESNKLKKSFDEAGYTRAECSQPAAGAPDKSCTERVTPNYTCEQQKGWGKCEADWMIGGDYCAITCERQPACE